MDKAMQNQDEMQDEELYALLEQALEQERLCVSEELIQKTLKKIETQETVERMPKQKAKKYVYMRYASVAAAAVLLVALGIGMKDGIGMNKAANDATPDFVLSNAESNVAFEYDSRNDERGEAAATRKSEKSFESNSEISYSVSEELADKYELDEPEPVYLKSTVISMAVVRENAEAGDVMAENDLTAECWEFVEREDDWEAELIEKLSEWKTEDAPLPKSGEYVYTLACNDGSKTTIGFREPLTMVLRIQTEQGAFWCLCGEEMYLYKEN